MTLKQILGWAAVLFIVWFTVEQPANAGHIVHNIGSFLATAAVGFSTFVKSI
jgi:hypothetical protein